MLVSCIKALISSGFQSALEKGAMAIAMHYRDPLDDRSGFQEQAETQNGDKRVSVAI